MDRERAGGEEQVSMLVVGISHKSAPVRVLERAADAGGWLVVGPRLSAQHTLSSMSGAVT